MLIAWVRSLHFPSFGTFTVKGVVCAPKLVLKRDTVIVLMVVEGRGRVKYINGSNVIETLLQIGHTRVDLY